MDSTSRHSTPLRPASGGGPTATASRARILRLVFLLAVAQVPVAFGASAGGAPNAAISPAPAATNLNCAVSWVGNSFSGADDKWVQNFFIHMNTAPDGSCYTWSHWDEGGKRFGVYRDGDIVGNRDVKANSLSVKDKQGRTWSIAVRYTDPKHQEWDFVPLGIQCDGKAVVFPDLFQPTALALANDGRLMVADSLTLLQHRRPGAPQAEPDVRRLRWHRGWHAG